MSAAGQRLEGGELNYRDVRIEVVEDALHLLLVGQMETAPSVVRDAGGKAVQRFPGGTGVKRVAMVKKDATWLVEGLFP